MATSYFHIVDEIKLLAITKKLNITEEDLSAVVDSEKAIIGKEKWNKMEKELFNNIF
jgi:hypothetical protein